MLHVAGENSMNGADGGVSILLVMNKLSFERTCKHHDFTHLLSVVPIKICSVHIIRQPARLGVALFDEKVVPIIKAILQPLKNTPVLAHCGSPSVDLREDLASHGYEPRNLPRSLGGGWSYQDFQEWREQRLVVERNAQLQTNNHSQGNPLPELPSGGVADSTATASALTPLRSFPMSSTSIAPTAPSLLEMQLNLLALQEQQQIQQAPHLLQSLLKPSNAATTNSLCTNHGTSLDGAPWDYPNR
jgi:hypothetical protein